MNIRHLIAKGENESVDFKKSITNNEKIARHIVAFANQKGGQLLVGIADDGDIKGVKSEDEERYMILKSCHQYIRPFIEPTFEEIYIDHKLVLIVNIPEGDYKPHYALDENKKWWAYIRIEDKSVLASKIMIEVLKNENRKESTLLEYSEKQSFILKYIEENGEIDLKTFCKKQKLSHKNGQKIIIQMIMTGILSQKVTKDKETFILKKQAY